MTPYYADDWLTVYGGDCREVLASLPADSVDCVVSSPPYWGLRDYGTATWSGGDADCDHSAGSHAWATATEQAKKRVDSSMPFRGACGRCGASRTDSQLGLEPTPEEYVANLVAVFAEVRRVLKPSGTCWLNLGDSYSGGGGFSPDAPSNNTIERRVNGGGRSREYKSRSPASGLKPKDLVGIPWRVAFALQADGWYLRSDIIWAKPNPMPESVTDRPTKSHEYLFLLTKSARYFFDADAVRESAEHREWRDDRSNAITAYPGSPNRYSDGPSGYPTNPAGRNIRSVWTIATRPYVGAHFAVFPPELPERCIKAGSSERGVCPECGAPWERVVERTGADNAANEVLADYDVPGLEKRSSADRVRRLSGATYQRVVAATNSWRSTCLHSGNPTPAVILDPFAGSGTVGMVANRLSRRAILIDLNPEYLKQQMRRNAQTPLGLAEVSA